MDIITKIKKQEIKKIAEKYNLNFVILFGSRARGDAYSQSDFDIGIDFINKKLPKEKPMEIFGSLQNEFSDILQTTNVDVVYLIEAPLKLQYMAVRDGIILYQKSSNVFADFKEKIFKYYFDFKFFESIFNQAFLGQNSYDKIRAN